MGSIRSPKPEPIYIYHDNIRVQLGFYSRAAPSLSSSKLPNPSLTSFSRHGVCPHSNFSLHLPIYIDIFVWSFQQCTFSYLVMFLEIPSIFLSKCELVATNIYPFGSWYNLEDGIWRKSASCIIAFYFALFCAQWMFNYL